MYWITQHCDYDVLVLNYALSNKWFEFEFEIETWNFPIENFQISIYIVSSSKSPKIKIADHCRIIGFLNIT
jgi:hypothetical protein